MNIGNIYDTSIKTFHSFEAGLNSVDGYFRYLLPFICYVAFTQRFDLVKRNLSDCSSTWNMCSHRLIDTDRHFSKICLKPCEIKIYIQAHKHLKTYLLKTAIPSF